MLVKLTTETRELIYQDGGEPDFYSVKRILHQYAPEIFGGEIVDIPSIVLYTNKGYRSTYRNDKGCSRNCEKSNSNSYFKESVLSGELATEDFVQMSEAIVELPGGTIQTVLYGIDMYEEGFVISTGKKKTNFLGMSSVAYLDKITSTSLKHKTRNAAKHFKGISDVLKYVKKYEDVFRFAVSQYGYQWSWEYASDVFKEFHHENMSQKKQASFDACIKELNELLDSVNGVETAETERIYGDSPKEEAILRLKEFGVASFVINNFVNGKIQISDVGGIIYDLDEFGEELVNHLQEEGHTPYLVLRNGPMYSVLAVHKNRECWPGERYDTNSEITQAYCTMKEMGVWGLEYGSIMVQCTNAGGLMRTA